MSLVLLRSFPSPLSAPSVRLSYCLRGAGIGEGDAVLGRWGPAARKHVAAGWVASNTCHGSAVAQRRGRPRPAVCAAAGVGGRLPQVLRLRGEKEVRFVAMISGASDVRNKPSPNRAAALLFADRGGSRTNRHVGRVLGHEALEPRNQKRDREPRALLDHSSHQALMRGEGQAEGPVGWFV